MTSSRRYPFSNVPPRWRRLTTCAFPHATSRHFAWRNSTARDETLEVYEEVLGVTANNPYRDDSRLALARLAVAQKHPNEALKQFEALSREATKPALQAESALKAGLIARELGQLDTAATLLARASSLPAASPAVRADAQIAQLHLLYDANKYQRLLDIYNATKTSLPENIQAEAMLMAGNSLRQLARHTDAQAIYDEILARFPKSTQVFEARYQRIISLYASNGANFAREADDFLRVNTDPVKGDQVRLMKADSLFSRKDYPNAAVAYAALDNAGSLPSKYKAEASLPVGLLLRASPPAGENGGGVQSVHPGLSRASVHAEGAGATRRRLPAAQGLQKGASGFRLDHRRLPAGEGTRNRPAAESTHSWANG